MKRQYGNVWKFKRGAQQIIDKVIPPKNSGLKVEFAHEFIGKR
jgi:hypothetical protein